MKTQTNPFLLKKRVCKVMSSGILYTTKVSAFVVQIVSTIFMIYAFNQPISSSHIPIKNALYIEFIVQIVQIVVYAWLLIQFHLSSMAIIRYVDWFITTPLLLLAFMIYLKYESDPPKEENSIQSFIVENQSDIYTILFANTLMLVFGFVGELGYISKLSATIAGFFAFAVAMIRLYNEFASKTNIGTLLFVPFAIIWSSYGIAYNFSAVSKNIAYNFLDTIAKNAFGVFLSYKYISVSST